jgi:diguanylate cyclase (GGDEF)-like protein
LCGGLDKLSANCEPESYDLVVLDLHLPDSRGLDTFARLHAHAPEVPILIHTATDDETIAVQAVRAGAQDYLVKGRAGSAALARVIRYSLERHRKQVEVWNQSLLDELTGLYNRRGLLAMAGQQQRVARRSGRGFALFFADLDGLKAINDSHGHAEGDRALQCAAEALRQSFRDSDIVARLGGDEFVVLALDTAEGGTEPPYQRLQGNLKRFAAEKGLTYPLTFSVGVVRAEPSGSVTIEDLLAQADAEMYHQKNLRRKAG